MTTTIINNNNTNKNNNNNKNNSNMHISNRQYNRNFGGHRLTV